MSISPAKFTDGGRAMLNSKMASHQSPVSGKMINAPRRRIIVRLLVRSYMVLARQNRADDVRP